MFTRDAAGIWHELTNGKPACGHHAAPRERRERVEQRLVCHACRALAEGWPNRWRRAVGATATQGSGSRRVLPVRE